MPVAHLLGLVLGERLERIRAGLADLRAHVAGGGHVELVRQLGVAARALVERADAVTLPLARHEQRRLDVEAEEVVLERRPVALAHEEAHEPRVAIVHGVDARPERHARRVDDREVVGHDGVQAHEAAVENVDRVARCGHRRKPNGRPRRRPPASVRGPQSAVRSLGLSLPPAGSFVTHSQR